VLALLVPVRAVQVVPVQKHPETPLRDVSTGRAGTSL
jgi:hypothetical protein